jgi:hypothetical protein
MIEKFPAVPQPYLATETVAGSHVLTVDGYSKTRGAHAVGERIESRLFRVGGHSWWIVFYTSTHVVKTRIAPTVLQRVSASTLLVTMK